MFVRNADLRDRDEMEKKKDKKYEIQAGLTTEFGKQVKYLRSIDEKLKNLENLEKLPKRIAEEIAKSRD